MTEDRWDICANYKQLATLARKLGLGYSKLDKWMRETNLGYVMSERTLGWQTSHRIDSQLVCDARWIMPWLVRVTQIVLWYILNKDQYFSRDFRALLLTNECIKSMSRSIAQYTAHVGIML